MPDSNVAMMYERFTWRMLANHVSPWEFEEIKSRIERWDDWCRVWCEAAEAHVKRGDAAAAEGHAITAGDAYVRAASFYHWASFYFVHDQRQFTAALEGAQVAMRKAAAHVRPSLEIVSIPFEGGQLPGYLRKPAGIAKAPLVIMCPGGDSTKEELYDLGEHVVARGMAYLAFDGSGQGLVSTKLKMRPDYEVVISAAIDYAQQRGEFDVRRIAVGGISYGGLFACRAAAFDERVRAAVSVSAWYTPAGLYSHMHPLGQTAIKQYFGPNAPDVQNKITMAGAAARIRVPLLQVYGGRDKASPPEQAYRVEKEVPGPVTTVVYEEGVHVCNNVQYKARPMIADWLAKQLNAGSA
ncbi:MAG: alpha/beta hydrolase family protein [Rhodospirillaceae bacterium]